MINEHIPVHIDVVGIVSMQLSESTLGSLKGHILKKDHFDIPVFSKQSFQILFCIAVSFCMMLSFESLVFSEVDHSIFWMSPLGGISLASFSFVAYIILNRTPKSARLAVIGITFATAYCFAFVVSTNICFHGNALLLEARTWFMVFALVPFIGIVSCFFMSLVTHAKCFEEAPPPRLFDKLNRHSFVLFLTKHPFVLSWAFMIAGSIPYVLLSWPTLWTLDAAIQTKYLITGEQISAWHPVIHTLWMSIPMKISNILTGNYFWGVVFYSVTQILATTATYACVVSVISKWSIPRLLFLAIVCFFVLYPGIGGYYTYATKDIAFSALFSLLIVLIFDSIIRKKKHSVAIWIVLLLVALFRNNAIYGVVLAFPIILLLVKRNKAKVLCSFLCLVLAFGIIVGPIYSLAGVRPTSVGEMLSVPLSQISHTYNVAANTFSEEQRSFVEEYIPTWNEYDPYLADSSKKDFPVDHFKDDPIFFFTQYFSIGFEHPRLFADAFLQLEIGYYAPVVFPIDENPGLMRIGLIFPYASTNPSSYNVHNQLIMIHASTPMPTEVLDAYNSLIEERWPSSVPGIASLFQIGTWLWLIIFYVAVVLYARKWTYLVPAVVFFGYWITCLFSPVSTVRYAMVAYTCAPLFFGALFVLKGNLNRTLNPRL